MKKEKKYTQQRLQFDEGVYDNQLLESDLKERTEEVCLTEDQVRCLELNLIHDNRFPYDCSLAEQKVWKDK